MILMRLVLSMAAVVCLASLASSLDEPSIETESVETQEPDVIKYSKYKKLNVFLNKKTKFNEGLDEIMKKMTKYVKEMLNRVLDKVGLDQYPVAQMKEVLEFYDTANKPACSQEELDMLRRFESVIENEVRSERGNHLSRRIDRVLSLIAYRYAFNCQENILPAKLQFPLLFLQRAYADLEQELRAIIQEPIETVTVDRIAHELHDMRRNEAKNTDRVYLRAISQIMSMIPVSSDVSLCNEEGYTVVLKNHLATNYASIDETTASTGLLARIVHHYAQEHAKTCQNAQ